MKKTIVTLMVCLMAAFAQAQEDYTQSLNGVTWVKIETKSKVTVKTHNKNELLIKARSQRPVPERAKGLKLVGAGGTDNTDVGFYVFKEGNNLIVKNLKKNEAAEIYLPKDQNVSVTNTWGGDIIIEGFSGEVEANANLNGGLKLKDISGPLTAYSLNSGIEVVFETIDQQSPIVINTTNGTIDITIPGNTSADLEMSSWNGEVYTNFDLKRPEKDGLKSWSSKKTKSIINNGGVMIKLKSTNGNIYLRKK